MDKHYLKSLLQISSISFRWKDFCFDENEIDYIEWLRTKAFEILSNSELKKDFKLLEIKKIINENKLKIDELTKKSIIWDSTIKSHSKAQYKIIAKYWSLDHEWKDENINILKFLAIIHDIWEIAVWDTIYTKKSKDWENSEKIVAKKIIKELYSWESGNFLEIYDIDSNENHPLHKEFKLYEILSYINWAILTYKNRENIEKSEEILKKVFELHIPRVICEVTRWRKSFVKYILDNLWVINDIAVYIWYDITPIFIALSENSRVEYMEDDAKNIINLLKENKGLLLDIFWKIDREEKPYHIFENFMNQIQWINNDKIMVFWLTDIFTTSILIYNKVLSKNQWKWILLANMKSGWKGKRYIYVEARRILWIIEDWKIEENKELIINGLKNTYKLDKKDEKPSCPFYNSENKNDFLESAINYFLEEIVPNIENNNLKIW